MFVYLNRQIVNPEAALLSTIVEIQDLSHRMFFNSLNCHANKLLDKVSLEADKVIFLLINTDSFFISP